MWTGPLHVNTACSPQYYSGPKHPLLVGQRLVSCFPAGWGEMPNSEPSFRLSSAPHLWSCQMVSSEGAVPQLMQLPLIFLQPCITSLIPTSPLNSCCSACSGFSCPGQPRAAVSSSLEMEEDEIPLTSTHESVSFLSLVFSLVYTLGCVWRMCLSQAVADRLIHETSTQKNPNALNPLDE